MPSVRRLTGPLRGVKSDMIGNLGLSMETLSVCGEARLIGRREDYQHVFPVETANPGVLQSFADHKNGYRAAGSVKTTVRLS